MGFLTVGHPLTWKESKEKLNYVREHGILQFIALYKRVKNFKNDDLFWGDEVEYAVLETSGQGSDRTVKLALVGSSLMDELKSQEKEKHNPSVNGCSWHAEYGSWMIEGTPQLPYSGFARDLVEVESNMRLRRSRLLFTMGPRRIAPTTTNFPLLGVRPATASPCAFSVPDTVPGGPASESDMVSDACINPHPRFGALTNNIRHRRGSKVRVRMPLFRDSRTPEFDAVAADEQGAKQQSDTPPSADEPLPYHLAKWPASWPMVEGDCMAFGMGCCCLQVTFQSRDVMESRFMYDQLANLSPVMLALTAATPIMAGRLLDTDARWSIISQSVDDRTPAERGLLSGDDLTRAADPRLVGGGTQRCAKGRYDSISCYLSPDTPERFNDVACEMNGAAHAVLLEAGMDPSLSRHVAHLFTRDPLVLFHGSVEELPDDGSVTDHWESLQSTNWQTMRWKPPPARNNKDKCAKHIGWRTEFRSMEVQLSDFENAAHTVFIVLLTRVLLVFDLDLRIPLSKVDENMARAHSREAVKTEKWWFRRDVLPTSNLPKQAAGGDAACAGCCEPSAPEASSPSFASPAPGQAAAPAAAAAQPEAAGTGSGEELFEEMTMEEIMGGKGDYFPGLVPLCYAYLDYIQCDETTFKRIDMYLTLILERASGTVGTGADWIRAFVLAHPDYAHDSVLSPALAHDLMVAADAVGRGALQPPELLGSAAGRLEPTRAEDAYGSPLAAAKLSAHCQACLVRRIVGQRRPRRERLAAQEHIENGHAQPPPQGPEAP